jgi:PAS domain S-box-containing protein
MMQTPIRVLLIEDVEDDALLIVRELQRGGYAPTWERVDTPAALRAALERHEWDLITCDWVMPELDAAAALALIAARRVDAPLIIISGEIGEEVAVSAMKGGAHDFVSKHNLARLVPAVERELRENALRRARRETDAAYRQLVQESLQGLAILQDDRVVFANPAMARITGRSSDEILSLSLEAIIETIFPEDRERVTERFRQRMAGEAVDPRSESRIFHRDGTVRWLETHTARIEYRGRPALQILCLDVTDRKRAEEALRNSEANLQAILNNTLQSFALLDREGKVRAFNQLASVRSELFFSGQPLAEQVSVIDFVPPADRDRFRRHFARALNGESVIIEAAVPRAGGERPMWFEVSCVPIMEGPSQQVTGVCVSLLDITERKCATDALRESEERFRTLADSAPVMIWVAGTDRRCTYFNRRWLDFRGCTIEQESGYGWADGVHPDDRQRCIDTYEQAFDRREPFTQQYRLRRADGVYRWALDSGTPRILPDGTFAGYVGSCTDVTERREAEEALHASERHYRLLIEHSHDLVSILEADGTIRYVSPSHARLLGYAREDVIGRNAFDFVHPEDVAGLLAEFQHGVSEPRRTALAEFRFRHADGSWRVLEAIAQNLLDDPTMHGIVVNSRDITDRRRAEDSLQETTARLQLTLEQVPVILWTTDRELRFTSISGTGLARLGVPPSQHLGRFLSDYFETADEDCLPITAHRRALAGESVQYEFTQRVRTFNVHLQPLRDRTGSITGVVGAAEDITEQRRIEAQLRQAHKLEAIGRLAGGVAHEFNNQLTVIKGSLQLLLAQLPDDAACRADAERIGASVDKSARLVRQLLTFSRQQPIEARALNVSNLILEMEPILQLLLGEQIRLRVRAAGSLPMVRVDRAQFEQVVINLVTNARDAIAPEGTPLRGDTVTIETDHVQLDGHSADVYGGCTEPGRYVMLAVCDNGPGIPPEVREHIFEPFFTTKGVGKGTGLGLATVFGVVQQHHGYVACASEPGHGAAFRVYLRPDPRDQP